MFQQMLNASRAVLLRPSVSTFEEYEKDDLGSATVYVVVAAIIAGILGAIAFAIQRPFIQAQLAQSGQQLPFDPNAITNTSIGGAIFGNLFGTLIGYFIFLGLVFGIAKLLFQGTGTFGQLAYDISLYWAPLLVIRALISIVGIGPLAILTGIVSFAVAIYNIYLTYLGVQAGMNLKPGQAIVTILLPVVLIVLVCCVFGAAIAALIGIASNTTSP
jgi:hypothetical protein